MVLHLVQQKVSQLGDLNTKCNGWIAAPNRNIDLPYPMQWWTLQLRKFQTPLRITFLSACRLISGHVLPSSMFLFVIYSCYHSRSEEHTSDLKSLMRISYSVFCLKKKKNITTA